MALVTNQQDRDQLCQLLTEAVTMLCKNLLTFSSHLCIEGLIGVTTDSTNVILVNIKETVTSTRAPTESEASKDQTEVRSSPVDSRHKSPKPKRRRSNSPEAEQSQISTESKQEVMPEPAETVDEKSRVIEARLQSIKQECDTARYTDQYDQLHVDQTVLGKSCSSPLPFENDMPDNTVPTEWSDYNDASAQRASVTLPESTLLPWSHAGHSLEQIQGTEPYELMDHQSESHNMPHPNKISFTAGKDRNPPRHSRVAPSDYTKKHGSLSFSVEQDPSGSELFVCECGEPFRHRSSLYRHQMVHLGMAYRCDLCGIIMNRKDNLLTHKRRYCLAQKQMNKAGDYGN